MRVSALRHSLCGCLLVMAASVSMAQDAAITAGRHGHEFVYSNGVVTMRFNRETGMAALEWKGGAAVRGIASGAQVDTTLRSTQYASHDFDSAGTAVADGFGSGRRFTIVNRSPGLPDLVQQLTFYVGKPFVLMQAELRSDHLLRTNHFDVLVADVPNAVHLAEGAEARVLHVPFDNDMWFRYASQPVSALTSGQTYSSSEVTAVYDNSSRQGIVLGSIAHNVWKTAIDVRAAQNSIDSLDIYGGISAPTGVRSLTHDSLPHGEVSGRVVQSPLLFVGYYDDWREAMEAYGRANAVIQPPLKWDASPPFGWNSWAAYGEKIDYSRYLNAAQFVAEHLVPEGFESDHVVYISFDAFWDRLNVAQLRDVAAIINGMHPDGVQFKPGIYWTPFSYWSNNLDAPVEGTDGKYTYRDILLKGPDGKPLPKLDGSYAIDPSHPGAKQRTDLYMKTFRELGFRFLKLDFMTDGALEGKHYDPSVETGIEAYNMGMQQLAKDADGKMFLSLSIAPIFPSGYAQARRISCDTKGHISGHDQSTEYMLNSLTYGWWTNRNLFIADPDAVTLGSRSDQGARNLPEARSRFLSAAITGGMVLDSSAYLDDPDAPQFAEQVYGNPELNALAHLNLAFEPVEGDTGDQAANVFMWKDGGRLLVAFFNFNADAPANIRMPLARLSSEWSASTTVKVRNVSEQEDAGTAQGSVSVTLAPAQSRLLELTLQ
jgi:alpha-galactosidase